MGEEEEIVAFTRPVNGMGGKGNCLDRLPDMLSPMSQSLVRHS